MLLVSGGLLAACLVQSEYLLIPFWLEGAGRALYRVAYFVVLPFRALVVPVLPPVHHHWTLAHTLVVGMGTPFFYWGLWRLYRRFRPVRSVAAASMSGTSAAGIDRRQFLSRVAAGSVGVAMSGVGTYGVFVAPDLLKVRRYEIAVPGLPAALDGLRVVHVSDTHYGPFLPLEFLQGAVARVNALRPDLVVLTGDYVHRSAAAIDPGIGIFSNLKSRLGTVAVLGNHDHWEGQRVCEAAFARAGIPLLDNRRTYLDATGLRSTPTSTSICVAGVGDLWEDVVSFEQALSGVPSTVPRIVLSHNPDVAELVPVGIRVDALFAGHTHGGQVSLPLVGAPIVPSAYGAKYLGGLCQGPGFPVLVSRGVGLAGIPVRFGVDPELGLITLRCGAAPFGARRRIG